MMSYGSPVGIFGPRLCCGRGEGGLVGGVHTWLRGELLPNRGPDVQFKWGHLGVYVHLCVSVQCEV